jgi:V-type H+-transporting ATPase subunit d
MIGCMFNIDGGYLEGLCRGFKCGILKQADYLNLVQCETLEGEKIILYIIVGILLFHISNLDK